MKRKICIFGERPVRSAPSLTLTRALGRLGFACQIFGFELCDSMAWLREARRLDAIVLVVYQELPEYYVRQLALAVAMGRPVVRWWVGTDVLGCLEDEKQRRSALLLDRIVSLNVAVAPHLVAELDSIGIKARYIPSLLDEEWTQQPVDDRYAPKQSLLVYLPTDRRQFYGEEIVRRVVAENQDIGFVVVADDEHSLADFPNVQSLGWVENMRDAWARVGGLLRVTRHDGLPRMVLDALIQSKYVIYSWPLPGCWHAENREEVQEKLELFRNATTSNHDGMEAVKRIFTPEPAHAFARAIDEAIRKCTLARRLAAAREALILTMAMRREARPDHP